MNKTLRKYCNNLRPGTYIIGKWHNEHYLIKGKLGAGAVGSVYLCDSNGKEVALKISEQSTSMTIEVNVLKSLNKVQGAPLGPCLLDVDDWEASQGLTYSFYVMEYLQGESMLKFIKNNGTEWMVVFMLQILDKLERLHRSGWIFGDLKLDNLLVLSSPPRVRFVDVGGTTQVGRAVKEYTEFYDRGYWGLGSRKAEPSYDLFALVMVCLHLLNPHQFQKTDRPKQVIFRKIDEARLLVPYKNILKQAVIGKYKTSAQMKQDIISLLYKLRTSGRNNQKNRKNKSSNAVELSGILLLTAIYYFSSVLLL